MRARQIPVPLAGDPILLDCADLKERLDRGEPPVQVFRDSLKQGTDYLNQRFLMGAPVKDLVQQRAWLVDQLLVKASARYLPDDLSWSVIAVGGYGRGELHPGSDIDIAIIVASLGDADLNSGVEQFLTFLWDIGMELGHSVRTLAQCREEATNDITVVTNLLEARFLAGSEQLFETMEELTSPYSIWPSEIYFEAKLKEQMDRHHKYGDTAYRLEPNIKEGPGGLRDIQMIGWVAKRHFGARTLRDLVEHEFLTPEEYLKLDAGQSFLWRIRYSLHLITGRGEDRLLFEHQKKVAESFGYTDDCDWQRGVEIFMKMYYRTVMELSRLNEMLLALFREAILYRDQETDIEPLNKRFQIRNGLIEVCNADVFQRYPYALLEIFLLLQQHSSVTGVRASTIRLIRDHRHLIDEEFRSDLRARSLFMEILRQPRRLGHELQRMHKYGILEAYIPAFEAIVGQTQFDLLHTYTVDEHILIVVRNMRRYAMAGSGEELSMCVEIMSQIPKPELLYISGLFHDIAKGRGGNHSELGQTDAEAFCQDHYLGDWDSQLVGWLVAHHLEMSITAQRKDISDPEIINEFARLVGDKVHLDYLYLLTVADIRGTNPTIWNSWKSALLSQLYNATLAALRRGIENPLEKSARIATKQGAALASLCRSKLSQEQICELWNDLGDDYFLRHWPDEIAWQTEAIISTSEEELPIVLVREETPSGGSEIFVYAHDYNDTFAATTRVLDQLGLTVMDARVITTKQAYTLDTYTVLDAGSNQTITPGKQVEEIIAELRMALADPDSISQTVNRLPDRQMKHFTMPTTVSFSKDQNYDRTVMEVITTDRPGLLSRIGVAMQLCGVRVENARIATFGERVEDIFYITDLESRPLKDPVKFECLRSSIIESLGT